MDHAPDILELVSAMKAKGTPFALATVVRTIAATAAKAGAKAVILPDGTISEGWIGGGCARAAVLKAAKESLADGKVKLVSIQPADLLAELGVAPGEEKHGTRFARNTCPSQGTMDIFVEPVLPRPEIVVCGSSPVAVAVADLGRRLGFAMTACAPAAEQAAFADVERRIDGFALPVDARGHPLHRRLDAKPRRRGGAAGGAFGRCRLCRLRRQPAEGRDAQGEAPRPRCRSGAHRRAEGAGGPRPRRHHARGDRALDPRRDRGAPPQGPAGDAEPVTSILDNGSTRRIRGPVSAAERFSAGPAAVGERACCRQRR